jgi:hypothetical protein
MLYLWGIDDASLRSLILRSQLDEYIATNPKPQTDLMLDQLAREQGELEALNDIRRGSTHRDEQIEAGIARLYAATIGSFLTVSSPRPSISQK